MRVTTDVVRRCVACRTHMCDAKNMRKSSASHTTVDLPRRWALSRLNTPLKQTKPSMHHPASMK